MKLTQLLERLEYEVVQGDDQIEVTELINESRKVSEGSVFVCISGAVSDGHTYIEQVAEKGAAAVIVEKDVEAPEGLTVIKVKDTPYALAILAAGCIILFIVSVLQERGMKIRESLAGLSLPITVAIYFCLLASIGFFGSTAVARGFIYAQF